MKSSLAMAAMLNAIALRSPEGVNCHSDRGGHLRAKKVQRLLANNGLKGSMGRSYGAGHDASMESFVALLQKSVLDTQGWDTREELRLERVRWIETKYKRRRCNRGLTTATPDRQLNSGQTRPRGNGGLSGPPWSADKRALCPLTAARRRTCRARGPLWSSHARCRRRGRGGPPRPYVD